MTLIDPPNRWRLDSPGSSGWQGSAQPGAPNKYLMISVDTHAVEPATLLAERVDKKFSERLPRITVNEKGEMWHVVEGLEPARYVMDTGLEGEDALRGSVTQDVESRIRDQVADGVDAEIIFPNKFLPILMTRDPEFAFAQARAYNDWAHETFGAFSARCLPMAIIPAMDVDLAIAEVERAAALGFRGLTLPVKPTYNSLSAKDPAYNWPIYDRLWAAIQAVNLPATFHVGTGRDPRTTRGAGGAVTNYVAHALAPSVEIMAILCSSGVLERFPGLKAVSVESGVGWLPWCGAAMDEAYRKHHMWALPRLKELPSHYLRTQCFGTFQEDSVGMALAEQFGYVDAMMWANDYPHHEGSWPHSVESIERQMQTLKEDSRAKILGLNAARVFGLPTDAKSYSA